MPKTSKKNCTHPRFARTHEDCGICEAKVGSATSAPTIPSGIYRLNTVLDNKLGKDGRSRDWQQQAEIVPGVYFVVPGYHEGVRITKYDDRGYNEVNCNHASHDNMVAALEPIEGSNEEWLEYQNRAHPYHGNGNTIVEMALKTGRLTRQDILDLIDTSEKEEE